MSQLGLPILKMQIKFESDITTARQKTRYLSELMGFMRQDQARIATAVSELARNVYQYAQSGYIEFFFNEKADPQYFNIKVTDNGPGIPHLENILDGQYVSETGMGIGLIGSKKLMDSFHIETQNKCGTVVTIGKALPKKNKPLSVQTVSVLAQKVLVDTQSSAIDEVQRQNRDILEAIDELEKKKNELVDLNHELSDTNRGVVALYAELDERASAIQRANDIKTSFLANMTHEFRTPLSSILSLTRILLDRLDGDLTPEQEKQINFIRKSGENLLELVNNLLDLSKVDAGKISVTSSDFDIADLFGSARGVFRPILGSESKTELNIIENTNLKQMHTDQSKLAQIIRNLISNAIKYTEKGSITLRAEQGPSDTVLISVTDTGMGIPAEEMQTIFDDFTQVHTDVNIQKKGTGLGLPLSRKLARLLGGDLWVDSTIGMGSRFFVQIPRVYSGAAEGILITTEPVKEAQTHIHKKVQLDNPISSEEFQILLIDDDESSRYVLKTLISTQIQAHFTEFSSARTALQFLDGQIPDLIFLDLNMPGIDGLEFIEKAKDKGVLKHTPIIINTSKILSDIEMSYLNKESVAILNKSNHDSPTATLYLKQALKNAGFNYKAH